MKITFVKLMIPDECFHHFSQSPASNQTLCVEGAALGNCVQVRLHLGCRLCNFPSHCGFKEPSVRHKDVDCGTCCCAKKISRQQVSRAENLLDLFEAFLGCKREAKQQLSNHFWLCARSKWALPLRRFFVPWSGPPEVCDVAGQGLWDCWSSTIHDNI